MAEDEQRPAKKEPDGALGGLVKAESMLQLALAVPVGCVLGLFLGKWLDGKFHTHWIVVLGMLVGSAGGFVQIFTYAARSMRNDK